MASYEVSLAERALKDLARLGEPVRERVFGRIERLATDPRPPGCRKLHGTSGLWRIRVGDYRVIYGIDDARRRVDVNAVRHRSDAYR